MSDKFKYVILLLVVSISFVLMLSIEPVGTPGDYLLESIGLKAWSGGHTGFHLVIIYFGIPFVLGLKMLGHYRRKIRIGSLKTFVYSVILITCLNYSVVEISKFAKGHSEGLLSIGFDRNKSTYELEKREEYTKFCVQIKMTNYSSEKRRFKLSLDSRHRREENPFPVYFLDSNGKDVVFELEGKETKLVKLDSENYLIRSGELEKAVNSSFSSGSIQELILEGLDGEKVKISSEGFFGVVIEVAR